MNALELINKARYVKYSCFKSVSKRELWTVKKVCNVVGAKPPKGIDLNTKFSMLCCFDGVFIKDCLFFLYEWEDDERGRAAMRKGASAILCTKQIDNYPCIIVQDVLQAFLEIGQVLYQEIQIPAVVVTGSIGKTSTKYFLNSVFSTKYRTFCNPTNGNSQYYLGYELQRFDKKAEILVQEVNENDPRSTSNCSRILHPHIALITNMDRSHIGELGSEENIIQLISAIADGMGPDDYVITNGDDLNSEKVTFVPKRIRVSTCDANAECFVYNISRSSGITEYDLIFNGEKAHLKLPIEGEHNVYNASMAFVAGRLDGIPTKDILRGLLSYRPLGYRQNTFRTKKYIIYADCYNASGRSMASAIAVMNHKERRPGEKKIAVLGDIAEIEGFEKETYESIAKELLKSDIDILYTYGKDSKMILRFLKGSRIRGCHSNEKDILVKRIKMGLKHYGYATVLFKASRSMHLEEVIKEVFPIAYIRGMVPVWSEYIKWTIRTL